MREARCPELSVGDLVLMVRWCAGFGAATPKPAFAGAIVPESGFGPPSL